MDIQINFEYDKESLAALPLEDLVRFVLEWEEKPENTEVSISFVENEKIATLNERYRGIKGATDVLSFECDGRDDEMSAEGQDSDVFVLGDIVIAPDVARAQTQEYGTQFDEEINLLLVHGLLHLCGYDHIEEEEAEQMEALEAEILKSWSSHE